MLPPPGNSLASPLPREANTTTICSKRCLRIYRATTTTESVRDIVTREAAGLEVRFIEDYSVDRDWVAVSTTTEHLAQRIGHALNKAYGGEVHYDFSHENKLARVSWHRD